ncbi:chemokine-like protein TAFA-5a isoform X1 [Plectropomus leopardus]|uniref:chemokine-like protein TAFA-5a isoform X1 n=1 Tax=Plectropomus leopardus TaxID=160734 RepID=UPI001C4C5FD9|nr:chemokine-like protein TAFA-5a isoform X1 [Plectropomus leopardus]
MESIDDPLTDSQKPSANTTLPPPPPTTSQLLHPNPGPAKAGSNTSSYRAPRASWRQQGLITQPGTGKPGSDCLREQTLPWTLDKLLAVKHFPFPMTGPLGIVTAPSCHLSLGQNVASTSSPLYLPAL